MYRLGQPKVENKLLEIVIFFIDINSVLDVLYILYIILQLTRYSNLL